MKVMNPVVSQQTRKSRKRLFTAPSHVRRVLMSSSLSEELRKKYNIKSLPIKKGDEVKVVVGHPDRKKLKPSKVKKVYRKKFQVFIDGLNKKKLSGQTYDIPVHASNLVITKLNLDKDRKALIARKAEAKKGKEATKIAEKDVEMQ